VMQLVVLVTIQVIQSVTVKENAHWLNHLAYSQQRPRFQWQEAGRRLEFEHVMHEALVQLEKLDVRTPMNQHWMMQTGVEMKTQEEMRRQMEHHSRCHYHYPELLSVTFQPVVPILAQIVVRNDVYEG